jgi:uncharacterized membrane protein YqgA involved in biofilm formation
MIGTYLNTFTVLLGGALGLLLGSRLPERLRQTVIAGLGLFTFAYGISMFLKTTNSLIVLGSILIGAILGEWWGIETGLEKLGAWLEARFMPRNQASQQTTYIKGFMTASLVFCVGPMTILGSIQDGLTGNYQLLAVKSVLDGFAALAFASSLGAGVLFSAGVVLVYQGAISLLAGSVQSVVSQAMMAEMTAAGGVILLAIAISSLLEIKKIRAGNLLPALVIAPLITAVLALLNVKMP